MYSSSKVIPIHAIIVELPVLPLVSIGSTNCSTIAISNGTCFMKALTDGLYSTISKFLLCRILNEFIHKLPGTFSDRKDQKDLQVYNSNV